MRGSGAYVLLYMRISPGHPDEGLSIFMPLQDNCYGDAAGFQVKIKSKVVEQEMRLKNTEIDEHHLG